jgi:hypothetical protein
LLLLSPLSLLLLSLVVVVVVVVVVVAGDAPAIQASARSSLLLVKIHAMIATIVLALGAGTFYVVVNVVVLSYSCSARRTILLC